MGLGPACPLPRGQGFGTSLDRPGGGRSLGEAEAPHPPLGRLAPQRLSEAPPAIWCPSGELQGLAGSHAALGEAHLFTGHCLFQDLQWLRVHGLSPADSSATVTSTAARPGRSLCFVRSVLILVPLPISLSSPPSVGVPSCAWDPMRHLLLLHFPQPRHPSLALGAGSTFLPTVSSTVARAWCSNTPRLQPQTRAMRWPNTGFQSTGGVWEAMSSWGQLGDTSRARLL